MKEKNAEKEKKNCEITQTINVNVIIKKIENLHHALDSDVSGEFVISYLC